jgi:hypothetical protein
MDRQVQIKLAIMLQKLYRGTKGKDIMLRLLEEAFSDKAARAIQRIYRGHVGRRRFELKREFVRRITACAQEVNPYELYPGHIEELADGIDFFIRDYTISLPTAVLAIKSAINFRILRLVIFYTVFNSFSPKAL